MDRFQEILVDELEGLRREIKKSSASWSDLLVYWVAQHFLDLRDRQLLQACGMQGPGEEGIDIFWVEDGRKKVIIGQAEAGEKFDLKRRFSRGIIDKLRRALAALNDEELARDGQSPISRAIEQYNEAIEKGYAIQFWAIIGGIADKGLLKSIKRFEKIDLKTYLNHSIQVIDAPALLTKYCAEVERLPYPDIQLGVPKGEHFNHGEDSILVTVTGKSIAHAVKTAGLHIFESNARLPLLRSEINKEIAATLDKPDGCKLFWNFNNGLTILCRDFSWNNERLDLKEAQIVNGCQTAYTLSKNAEKLDHVEVMCRIIRKSEPTLSERIRRATNLQNAIIERDLRSGDRIQKTLQRDFKRRGYFYERKRDEYKNFVAELGKTNVVAQFQKGNVDNLYLAQLALAFWHEKPAPAKMQAKKIFIRAATPPEEELPTGFYDSVFHENIVVEELLFPYLVSEYLYDKFAIGYRPQLKKRTRKYMVQTHGNLTVLALVGRAIQTRYRLELPVKDLKKKQLLSNFLIPRFENPRDYPEYFEQFDKGFRALFKGVDQWVARAVKKQIREASFSDIRAIFVDPSTLQKMTADRQLRIAVTKLQKHLPELRA